MNKKAIWGIVIVVVIVLIIVSSKGSNRSAGTIKIGAITPLTGWAAYWGDGYQKGVAMAVEDVKSKGGDLEVKIEDSATEGAKAATAAQKLISIDKVDGLVVEFTGPSSSVSPIALQNKVPIIYDAITRKILDTNPLAFKMYFDMDNQCYVAAKNLVQGGAKHIGGLIMNLDFAAECQAAMDRVSKETGVKVTYYLFDTSTTDFRTYIAKMKSEGIDAVVPVFYEDNAVAFFKQRSDLKFITPVFGAMDALDGFSQKVRSSVATSTLEGVMTYDQAVSPDFVTKLVAKYPTITEKDYLQAAYGYDEVMIMYRSLSNCDKGDTDCFISKMKSDTYSGPILSKGFTDARVVRIAPIYYKYVNGKLVEFDPTK